MPGGVPVATLAIGKAGATNAGLLAVAILADVAARAARASFTRSARSRRAQVRRGRACREPRSCCPAPRSACWAAGSSAGCSPSRPGGWATACTRSRPTTTRRPARSPTSRSPPPTTTSTPSAPSPRGVDVVTFEFENVLDRGRGRGRRVRRRCGRSGARAAHHAAPRAREGVPRPTTGFPVTPFAPVRHARRARRRRRHASACRRSSRPRPSATTARASTGSRDRRRLERVWALVGHQDGGRRARRRLRARALGRRRPRPRRRVRALRRHREHAPQPHPRPVGGAGARAAGGRRRGRRASRARSWTSSHFVGVLCVEFFLTADGELLVNEIAPRPHNSGHLTIDACVTSQFEQQVRAVCGLPLGSTDAAAARGDGQPARRSVGRRRAATGRRRWRVPDVKLHLYGKTRPAPGPQDGPSHRAGRHAGRRDSESAGRPRRPPVIPELLMPSRYARRRFVLVRPSP